MPATNIPRFRTPYQLLKDAVQGQPATWEAPEVYSGAAGVIKEVFAADKEKRKPTAIRIQNVGTQAVKWRADGIAAAGAVPDVGIMKDEYNGILSGGNAAEDGLGGVETFQKETLSKSLHLYAAAAYTVVITKRYAEDN